MGYSDAGRASLKNNKRVKKKFFGSFKNILRKHNLKKQKNSKIKKMDDFEMLKLICKVFLIGYKYISQYAIKQIKYHKMRN